MDFFHASRQDGTGAGEALAVRRPSLPAGPSAGGLLLSGRRTGHRAPGAALRSAEHAFLPRHGQGRLPGLAALPPGFQMRLAVEHALTRFRRLRHLAVGRGQMLRLAGRGRQLGTAQGRGPEVSGGPGQGQGQGGRPADRGQVRDQGRAHRTEGRRIPQLRDS